MGGYNGHGQRDGPLCPEETLLVLEGFVKNGKAGGQSQPGPDAGRQTTDSLSATQTDRQTTDSLSATQTDRQTGRWARRTDR